MSGMECNETSSEQQNVVIQMQAVSQREIDSRREKKEPVEIADTKKYDVLSAKLQGILD